MINVVHRFFIHITFRDMIYKVSKVTINTSTSCVYNEGKKSENLFILTPLIVNTSILKLKINLEATAYIFNKQYLYLYIEIEN